MNRKTRRARARKQAHVKNLKGAASPQLFRASWGKSLLVGLFVLVLLIALLWHRAPHLVR